MRPTYRRAAAVAAAVVVVCAGLLTWWLVARSASDGDDAAPPVPSEAGAGSEGNSGLGDDVFAPPSSVTALVRTDSGFLAAGTTGAQRNVALWDSPDGRTWTRRDDPLLTSVQGVRVASLAVRGGDALLVATSEDGATTPVVLAEAGGRWARVDPAVFGRDASRVSGAAAGPGTWVLVGSAGVPASPRMWWSVDLETWNEGVLAGGGGGDTHPRAVVAGAGGYVSVGTVDDHSVVAFRSPDGRRWEQVDSPAFHDDRDLAAVTIGAGPAGYIAGGSAFGETMDAAVWSSADGLTWTRVEQPSFVASTTLGIWGVAPVGDGWQAVGGEADDTAPAAWTSPDGVTWTRVEVPVPPSEEAATVLWSLAASPDVVVSAGTQVTGSSIQTERAIMVATER